MRRPRYHFTVPVGWINDPYGVTWRPDVGSYELFHQYNPEGPIWTPACRWGQATAPDLMRWTDTRTALEPAAHETGCWSGSVVVDEGLPVIVYTSVLGDEPGQGRVALAPGDATWRHWTPDPTGPVIPAPPLEQGLAHVRDPFVWRDEDGWRLLLGAGSTTGRPSVLQYSSPDLRSWRSDGVLVEGDATGPGGTVWECPQLFRLGGAWVLVVSLWDDGPRGVACAVGDYDGRRFVPRSWHSLGCHPLYALTCFVDAGGRRCALSWLQEDGPVEGRWAGALSVPWLLTRDGDRVLVAPHPDVDTARAGILVESGPAAVPLVTRQLPPYLDVELAVDMGVEATFGPGDRPSLTVAVRNDVRLSAPGRPEVSLPAEPDADGVVRIRLLIDAGVVELFTGGRAAAARREMTDDGLVLRLTALASGVGVRALTVYEMARVVG